MQRSAGARSAWLRALQLGWVFADKMGTCEGELTKYPLAASALAKFTRRLPGPALETAVERA